MVVPVLITSCQVSEKPKNGPDTAQTRTTPSASPNALALPVQAVIDDETCSSHPPRLLPTWVDDVLFMVRVEECNDNA